MLLLKKACFALASLVIACISQGVKKFYNIGLSLKLSATSSSSVLPSLLCWVKTRITIMTKQLASFISSLKLKNYLQRTQTLQLN
jgi:hypothetical protein